jgi:predicted nucleic-acid-binding protein
VAAPRLDANILLGYLSRAPLDQSARAKKLFESVATGETEVLIEDVVLAEVVWVLTDYYRMPRAEIAKALLEVLAFDGVQCSDKTSVQMALAWFQEQRIDFVGALLAARTLNADEQELYSFDRGLDRLPGLVRKEP